MHNYSGYSVALDAKPSAIIDSWLRLYLDILASFLSDNFRMKISWLRTTAKI